MKFINFKKNKKEEPLPQKKPVEYKSNNLYLKKNVDPRDWSEEVIELINSSGKDNFLENFYDVFNDKFIMINGSQDGLVSIKDNQIKFCTMDQTDENYLFKNHVEEPFYKRILFKFDHDSNQYLGDCDKNAFAADSLKWDITKNNIIENTYNLMYGTYVDENLDVWILKLHLVFQIEYTFADRLEYIKHVKNKEDFYVEAKKINLSDFKIGYAYPAYRDLAASSGCLQSRNMLIHAICEYIERKNSFGILNFIILDDSSKELIIHILDFKDRERKIEMHREVSSFLERHNNGIDVYKIFHGDSFILGNKKAADQLLNLSIDDKHYKGKIEIENEILDSFVPDIYVENELADKSYCFYNEFSERPPEKITFKYDAEQGKYIGTYDSSFKKHNPIKWDLKNDRAFFIFDFCLNGLYVDNAANVFLMYMSFDIFPTYRFKERAEYINSIKNYLDFDAVFTEYSFSNCCRFLIYYDVDTKFYNERSSLWGCLQSKETLYRILEQNKPSLAKTVSMNDCSSKEIIELILDAKSEQ